jgi:hypothetical protein
MTFIRSFAAGAWETLLDLDFTAQATQDLTASGDGTYTIGGQDFSVNGTATATTMAVTNGVGLDLVSSNLAQSDVRLYCGTGTAGLSDRFGPNSDVRVIVRVNNLAQDTNFDNGGIFMRIRTSAASKGFVMAYNTARRYFITRGAATAVQYNIPGGFTSDNIFVMQQVSGFMTNMSALEGGGVGTIADLDARIASAVPIYQEYTAQRQDDANLFTQAGSYIEASVNQSQPGNRVTIERLIVQVPSGAGDSSVAQSQGNFPLITAAVVTTATTLTTGFYQLYDPSGGTFTITMPAAPSRGDLVGIKNNTSDTTAITLAGNGNNVEDPTAGGTDAASISVLGAGIGLVYQYTGSKWKLV